MSLKQSKSSTIKIWHKEKSVTDKEQDYVIDKIWEFYN
jgi:hypothetical protein